MKYVVISVCVLLAGAGLFMAALPWLEEYADAPVAPVEGLPTQDGLPLVDPDNLPELYPVTKFAMFDQDNDVFASEELDGIIWVGYLFFTGCPGQCPIMTSNMKKVAEAMADEEQVHIAGISVDPTNDTPERLTQYRGQYGIDSARWHLLTGPMQHVQ